MRGRILRVRPGHLSNFSGGAGYMPFVVIYSVPASFLLWLIASIVLCVQARRLRKGEPPDASATQRGDILPYAAPARVDTQSLLRSGLVVLGVAGTAAAIAATWLFVMSLESIYGDRSRYAPMALVLAAGPLVAAFVTLVLHLFLAVRMGRSWSLLPVSLAVFIALLIASLFLGGSLS